MRPIDADFARDKVNLLGGGAPWSTESVLAMLEACPTIAQPPNDPLTLSELREMDGEPVFIKRIGSNHPDDSAWALVDVGHELCKTVDGVKAFFEFFGKSWLAYRRKQEEGAE